MPKGSDGMSKGFAFIEFKNPQVRQTARAGQEQEGGGQGTVR
jgi:RNA recognition motif-containing protein